MSVESNNAIVFVALSDRLKNRYLAPVFQPMTEAKPKSIASCEPYFSRASGKLQVIARNSDWFIALFAPLWCWCFDSHLKIKTNFNFLKKLWCCVGGRVRHEDLVLSNELIKVEFPP